jgi:cell division transport system permease protein
LSALAKLSHFGRSAAQGMRHAPFVHLVAVNTIAIALFALGLALGGSRLLEGLIQGMGSAVQLTVYLDDDVSGEAAQALVQELSTITGGHAELVAPAVALGRLARDLGPLGDALVDLPENPLPPSIEVKVPPGVRTPEEMATLASKLRERKDTIRGVDYGEEALERLSAIVRALRFAGLIAFAVVVIATILIVAATLQLAIYARRQEIEIQKLVGATDRFVKAPFLLEGLLQGLLGASLALVGLWLFSTWATPRMASLFAFLWLPGADLSWMGGALVWQLCATGAGLGFLGSFLAVSRFSRV